MPVCPHPPCTCARSYATVESLIEHVLSSPWAASYYCDKCKCVCRDETTLKNHAKRVHGIAPAPTLNPNQASMSTGLAARTCTKCNRSYFTTAALEQHFHDSSLHPNCARCDLGFLDAAVLSQHVVATHHPIACELCNGLQIYREDVASHYRVSPNHPTCPTCNVGFENTDAFDRHIVLIHPELRCRICDLSFGSAALLEEHYRDSAEHPKCPECQISFVDERELIKHVLTVFNPLIKDSGRLTLRGSQTARSSPIPSSSRIIASQATSLRSASLPPQPQAPSGVKQWAEQSLAVAVVPVDSPPAQSGNQGAGTLRSTRTSLDTTCYPSASSSKTHPMSPYTPDSAASVKAKVIEPSIRPSDRLSIVNLLGSPRGVVSPIPTRPARLPTSAISENWPMPRRNSAAKASSERSSDDDDRSSSAVRTPSPVEAADATDPPVVHGSPTHHDLHSSSCLHAAAAATATTMQPSAKIVSGLKRASSNRSIRSARLDRGQPTPTPRPLGPIGTLGPMPPPSNPSQTRPPFRTPLEADSKNLAGRYQAPATIGFVDHEVSYQHPVSVGLLQIPSAPGSIHVGHMSPTSSAAHTPFPPRHLAASQHATSRSGHTPGSEANETLKYVSHVYCRMCRRDPCLQPTATMCGHIFCSSCIFPEVQKTSRCPVCEAPTLLYALFRLHVE